MKILELTKKHVKDHVSQKRIATYIMYEIMGCSKYTIRTELNTHNSNINYYLSKITDYDKLIASYVIEDIDVINTKLDRIKQLDKEIRSKEKQLTYIEVPSLYEPNVCYRFYEDGREEKVKKRPKKDA